MAYQDLRGPGRSSPAYPVIGLSPVSPVPAAGCSLDIRAARQREDMEATAADNDEPCAYAKLWGQLDGAPFHCYVTTLPSTLGRGSAQTEGARKPAGFIDLGRSKALSREHGEGDGRACRVDAVRMKESCTFEICPALFVSLSSKIKLENGA